MNSLAVPDGWEFKTVLELGQNARDTVQTGPFGAQLHAEDYVEEGIPLILIRNIKDYGLDATDIPKITERDALRLARYALKKGDVVFSRVGRVGSCFLAEDKYVGWIISGQTLRIRLPDDAIDPYFFVYALRDEKAQDYISGSSVGTTRTSINTDILESLPILLPTKKEQQKIAKILTTVDNLIEETEALIEKYQAIKQGMMHDLFTCGIDTNGQLRPSHHDAPHLYKETELGWIPKEWPIEKLGSIAEISSGITLGKNHQGPETIEVPYLRVANVQDGYLELTEIKSIRIPKNELGKVLLEWGDVLMNEGGDFDKLGRGTVWQNEIEGCAHQNHVFKVRTDKSRLDSQYLAYWSASNFGKRYFVLSSKQSTNLASINSTQLKSFTIVLPILGEQKEIVKRLVSVDSILMKLNLQNDKYQKLKKGLMQDLLTGIVRVECSTSDKGKN